MRSWRQRWLHQSLSRLEVGCCHELALGNDRHLYFLRLCYTTQGLRKKATWVLEKRSFGSWYHRDSEPASALHSYFSVDELWQGVPQSSELDCCWWCPEKRILAYLLYRLRSTSVSISLGTFCSISHLLSLSSALARTFQWKARIHSRFHLLSDSSFEPLVFQAGSV